MNNIRRQEIGNQIDAIRAALSSIEELKDQEQEAFDAMPESLQQSERGTASEEAAQALDYAVDSLTEACDYLEQSQA